MKKDTTVLILLVAGGLGIWWFTRARGESVPAYAPPAIPTTPVIPVLPVTPDIPGNIPGTAEFGGFWGAVNNLLENLGTGLSGFGFSQHPGYPTAPGPYTTTPGFGIEPPSYFNGFDFGPGWDLTGGLTGFGV